MPVPDQEFYAVRDKCEKFRAALKKIEGDALVAETRNDAQAIARYAHSVLTD